VIRFTPGAIRIAYDVMGVGEPALLAVSSWISHLEYDWARPEIRAFYQLLAGQRCVIRYDKRGCGLSDRPPGVETFALDTQVEDVAAVLDAAGITRAALLGWGVGGPIALAFAARCPDRVSHLILYGTYAKTSATPDYPCGDDNRAIGELIDLIRAEWRQWPRVLADLIMPEADLEQLTWLASYQRMVISPQAAADFLTAANQADVRALLPAIDIPALVLHRLQDTVIPFRLGAYLAQHLPNATLRELTGERHSPYFGDSATITDAIAEFLHAAPGAAPAERALSGREIEVLRLVAEGYHNDKIASHLGISRATVGRHLANIYLKLGVSTRGAAAAFAFRHGLA
jgi:pimeloyl-ACP methyl ester carboxylesterase/DNA-binding CsgD family transcriptional regulator